MAVAGEGVQRQVGQRQARQMFGLRPPFGEDQAYRIDTGRLRDPAQFVLGPRIRGPQPKHCERRFTQGLEPDGEDLRGEFVGLVEGTQHFRNVSRYDVLTTETIASFRIDENLNFLNAHVLKGYIITELSHNPQIQHVVINCSSISNIDLSAVEMLEELNGELLQLGIQLHLSEVKSPVMDRLNSSRLINMLSGKIFLSHYQAIQTLSPEILHP